MAAPIAIRWSGRADGGITPVALVGVAMRLGDGSGTDRAAVTSAGGVGCTSQARRRRVDRMRADSVEQRVVTQRLELRLGGGGAEKDGGVTPLDQVAQASRAAVSGSGIIRGADTPLPCGIICPPARCNCHAICLL
eukprot:scaffold3944_cov111-Isochrysis_galbana.AAC.11